MKNQKNLVIIMGIIGIITATVAAVCILLNIRKQKSNKTFDDYVLAERLITFGDEGILFSDSGMLKYYDAASGQGAYICDKPECRHLKNDSECFAVFNVMIESSAYYNDSLYYLSISEDYGILATDLWIADKNGSNRRKLLTLKDMQYIYKAVFTENRLYIYSLNQEVSLDYETGMYDTSDKRKVVITSVDLDSLQVEYLVSKEDYQACIVSNICCTKDKLYYIYSYQDVEIEYGPDLDYTPEFQEFEKQHTYHQLFCLDLDSKEEKCLYEGKNIRDIAAIDDKLFYLVEEDISKIYVYDESNNQQTQLEAPASISEIEGDNYEKCLIVDEAFNDSSDIKYYIYRENEQGAFDAEIIGISHKDVRCRVIRVTPNRIYFACGGPTVDGIDYSAMTRQDFYEGRLENLQKVFNTND